MNGDLCNKVVTIPQYLGTCWFNAILMMFLYSQYSRKLLIENIFFSKKSNKLEEIFYDIIHNYYIDPNKAITYFNVMRPEEILREFNLSKKLYENMIIKGYYIKLFMSIFLTKININHLVLDYYSNKIFVGINKYIIANINKKRKFEMNIDYSNFDYTSIIDDNQNYKDVPQYIIVNLWDIKNKYMYEFNKDLFTSQIFNIYTYYRSFKFKNLYELKDKIEFNGHTYILDSCGINNYNRRYRFSHAIAGITCENNRYIYNGWIRNTLDYNIKTPLKNPLPCELMKYDWDIHKPDNKFCLDKKKCTVKNLDITNEKNLCFSLNKGDRTLIYVLCDDKEEVKKTSDEKIKLTKDEIKKTSEKKCPKDKILNPKTNRCVKIDGKIGKMILRDNM
jgi:hypothetical protein